MKGVLTGVDINYATRKKVLQFEVEDTEGTEFLAGKPLRIDVKEWREKRSLDANAYAWVLIGQIANALNTSANEVYEIMLHRYGVYDAYTVTVKRGADIHALAGHWRLVGQNERFDGYIRIKGSSEYDSKEMATFIDGVVSEAKELGIETRTRWEVERLKEEWQSQS